MAHIWKAFTVVVELSIDEDTFSCEDGFTAEEILQETASEIRFEDLEDDLIEMIELLTDNDLTVSQLEVKTIL